MGFSVLFLFLISSAFHINLTSSADIAADFRWSCDGNNGDLIANSTYKDNLNLLFSNLSDQDYNHGFYNVSVGQSPDQVNAIALCRGDKTEDICRICLKNTTAALQQNCANKTEAIGWSTFCTLRYSNRRIYRVMEIDPFAEIWRDDNKSKPSDPDVFYQTLSFLLKNLSTRAATGDPNFKCATGLTVKPDRIYALVQCTPDLSQQSCSACLEKAMAEERMRRYCHGYTGCRILQPSCNLRYEIDPFVDSVDVTVEPSPPPPSPGAGPSKGKGNSTTTTIIISTVASFLGILLLVLWIFLRKRKAEEAVETTEEMIAAESLQYNFATVQAATNNFNDQNKLGQGGFGAVYKGRLSNGQDVAVKRLSRSSKQGDTEFKNEVLSMAKLQHRNLVRLVGFCLEGNERLLIYEFLPNLSLDQFIFDPIKREQLDWERRYKIILDIARGLNYLHEESRVRIIHRDLKASNILLDEDMNAKIADFGTARLFARDETQGNTSKIVGTYGYMAPEYVIYGHFSAKSDVFSFGVLMLEIVSGQRNSWFVDGEALLNHAWKNWTEGTTSNLIDPTLRNDSRTNQMTICIHLGLLCVQETVVDRPTMGSVVHILNDNSTTLPVPSKPAFLLHTTVLSSDTSSSQRLRDKPLHSTKNDASITEPYPR
ncbi:hypothetical protein SLA2020_324600 [Shorea laevis]